MLSRILSYLSIVSRPRFAVMLSAAFEGHTSGICFASTRTFRIEYANSTMLKWLGYTQKELSSRPFTEFVHEDDYYDTLELANRMIEKGEVTADFKNRYMAANGEYVPLKWKAFIILDWWVCYTSRV